MIPREPEPEYMDLAHEAEAYATADFDAVNAVFVERLLSLSGAREGACAVDLGTGPADIPARVKVRRSGWTVVGVDASWAMLTWARRRLAKDGTAVSLVQVEGKTCPFGDATFDVLFSNSILHHVTDPSRLWREVRRLARPGALVFFRDLARPTSHAKARKLMRAYAGEETALLQEEFYRSLLAAYTIEEVRAQLDAEALTALDVTPQTDRHLDIFGTLR